MTHTTAAWLTIWTEFQNNTKQKDKLNNKIDFQKQKQKSLRASIA